MANYRTNLIMENLLAEREATHGVFGDQAAVAQRLKGVMHGTPNWDKLDPANREILEMAQLKISRLLHGDPCFPDHVEDLIGYFSLWQAGAPRGKTT